MNRKTRELIYKKYNGHCAYCGCKLEYKDMQVDHVYPKYLGGQDNIDNLVPSCRQCNFYKSTNTIEQFRNNIETTLKRNLEKNFNYRMLKKYGIVKEEPKKVIFYFEEFKKWAELCV